MAIEKSASSTTNQPAKKLGSRKTAAPAGPRTFTHGGAAYQEVRVPLGKNTTLVLWATADPTDGMPTVVDGK
jgi:hypothetical protein